MRNDAVRVGWRPAALADLEAVFAYLLPLNPYAAERVVQEVAVAADSLTSFPYRGRSGRVAGTRELVAAHPYIVVYEVVAGEEGEAESVTILRIWHGAQDR